MVENTISGREPRLSKKHKQRGQQRLSLRGLAGMLENIAPDAISANAARAMLRSGDFNVRYSAARLLGQRGDRESRLVIEEALTQGNGPTRASAARHLYGFSWFAAEPLMRLALDDGDERVREAAVYALCDAREKPAFELLAEVLSDASDVVLETAAWGLQSCQDPAAVPALAEVLKAQEPEVRIKALEALGLNDSPEAIPVIRGAIGDAEPDVVYAAMLSLMELLVEEGVAEAAAFINETRAQEDIRQAVIRGFFHASNYLAVDVAGSAAAETLLDALEDAMDDVSPGVRREATYPLAWMRHARAQDILRAGFAAERDTGTRLHMLEVVASLMSDCLDEMLAMALESDDASVVSAAERIAARVESGEVLAYDASAVTGPGFKKPLEGR